MLPAAPTLTAWGRVSGPLAVSSGFNMDLRQTPPELPQTAAGKPFAKSTGSTGPLQSKVLYHRGPDSTQTASFQICLFWHYWRWKLASQLLLKGSTAKVGPQPQAAQHTEGHTQGALSLRYTPSCFSEGILVNCAAGLKLAIPLPRTPK